MSQNPNITPYEFTSSLMDLIKAAEHDQTIPLSLEDSTFRDDTHKETLEEIERLLKDAMTKTTAEITKMAVQENERNLSSLPSEYAIALGSLIVQLESLLYLYSDTLRFDPYKIWEQINESKRTSCEKVAIQASDDMVVFHIPYLPKRNQGKDAVVNQMLASKIFAYHEFPCWPQWTATFYHVYPSKTKTIPRDVDNYDYKRTIDLLAFAFGSADNSINFDIGGKHTVFSNDYAPGVYIEVVPKSSENGKFPRWSAE